MMRFDFNRAFSRNLGWVTEWEQSLLRGKRVAIAGLGGVGGSHLLTLTRLGIGAFTLADFDAFELANFNRQAGAALSNLNRPKIEVMAAMARDINPELDLKLFPKGVDAGNTDAFLDGADVFLDGLDFFALETRRRVFARCAELRIPAVTVAPVGMGAALLNFLPDGMSFDEYFQMDGKNKADDLVRFLIGLSPRMARLPYLIDDSRADFKAECVPSTPMGCELAAGIAATEVLKILLNRGGVIAAPRGIHFDAYRNRLVRTWRPWGNRNLLQRLIFRIARKKFAAKREGEVRPSESEEDGTSTPARRVLQLARWAPSGDNLQQWRFEIQDDHRFRIYADNHSRDVYFLTPWPKMLALGGLLETVSVAATGEGLKARIERASGSSDTDREIIYDVTLVPDGERTSNPLLPFIRMRTTQRRALSKRPLSSAQKKALEEAAAPYRVLWLEEPRQKSDMARLASEYAKIRLTIPEAYDVHTKVIEWGARYSRDRIPDQAIGLDPVALKLMRWALGKWSRVRFLNTYMAGTFLPRLQLEVIPGRNSAGFAAFLASAPLKTIDDFVEAGRVMQRFWLTLTKLGLQFQPQMAPLIFDSYVRGEIDFTKDRKALLKARDLSPRLRNLLGGENYPLTAFLGRIGAGTEPRSRSLRKPLSQLT